MDLDLSEEQELFLDTTRRFLTANWSTTTVRRFIGNPVAFDAALWLQGAELGWTSMLVPEQWGGGTISGRGVCDLGIVAEELGRALFAGPVLPTNIVAYALARSSSEHLAEEHLSGIAAGREIAAWAVAEENERWGAETGGLAVQPTHGGFCLDGVKTPVQDAHVADQLLVAARTSMGVTQFLVPAHARGVSIDVLDGLDLARRFCRVRFDAVEVPASALVESSDPDDDLQLELALAVALQCAETVGATDRIYSITLQYVKDRKAFGRPIGSYQALKHRLADMLLWLESAKAITVAALEALESERGAPEAASVAKAYVADRCPVIVRECLQMHGGIGFTWEHDLHLFMRRIESNAAIYGDPDHHCDRLARAVGF